MGLYIIIITNNIKCQPVGCVLRAPTYYSKNYPQPPTPYWQFSRTQLIEKLVYLFNIKIIFKDFSSDIKRKIILFLANNMTIIGGVEFEDYSDIKINYFSNLIFCFSLKIINAYLFYLKLDTRRFHLRAIAVTSKRTFSYR